MQIAIFNIIEAAFGCNLKFPKKGGMLHREPLIFACRLILLRFNGIMRKDS
jgi:hypothetical protein